MKNNKIIIIFSLIASFAFLSCKKKQCTETPCNEGVPMSYIPVCGCNDVTYPNWETAECHGITNYKSGECND